MSWLVCIWNYGALVWRPAFRVKWESRDNLGIYLQSGHLLTTGSCCYYFYNSYFSQCHYRYFFIPIIVTLLQLFSSPS